MGKVVVSGGFDNIELADIRFLEEASHVGLVHALLWDDETIASAAGEPPKFPLAERSYYLDALRYVDSVEVVNHDGGADALPVVEDVSSWVVSHAEDSSEKAHFCEQHGIAYKVIRADQLVGCPALDDGEAGENASGKKVVVTGCYDWFHTGHIRFFEEVSALGDLYVCLGSDANIELLKGEGHPMFKEDQRCYMVQSIRFVKQALITTGSGWLDAEPEMERLKPDMYAVNEDGDKPEKGEYCEAHGIEYVVLKRTPAPGLPKRQSTDLRGF